MIGIDRHCKMTGVGGWARRVNSECGGGINPAGKAADSGGEAVKSADGGGRQPNQQMVEEGRELGKWWRRGS
ncbi:hypothetical protein ABEX25_29840 [Paenibacillus thiaminolyticus]|uniref:hypothetical protein n=1 Tax=Paenibacillus thiaminolyticus TaxID=49283 RepID=UPI003D28C8EC